MASVGRDSRLTRLPSPLLLLFVAVHVAAAQSSSCPICDGGTDRTAVGSWNESRLSQLVSPVANAALTSASLSVEGTTGQGDQREFLVNLGLRSNLGSQSRPSPYHDKVTLYAGIEAAKGTGDVWAINPLVTQLPGSGDYNAQGIELDFNNMNLDRGNADAGAGLAPPSSYGFSVTGAGSKLSTSAMLVSGPGTHRIWNRGITFANDCVAGSSFQDLGSPDKSVDIRGNPTYALYQTSPNSRNYLAGKTAVALSLQDEEDAAARAKSEASESPRDAAGNGVREPVFVVGAGDVEVRGPVLRRGAAPFLAGHDAATTTLSVPLFAAQRGQQEVVHVAGRSVLGPDGMACADLPTQLTPSTLQNIHGLEATDATATLTPVGAAMPSLHLAHEIYVTGSRDAAPARVCMAGGVPGGTVHWSAAVTVTTAALAAGANADTTGDL